MALSRRDFLHLLGAGSASGALGAAAPGGCGPSGGALRPVPCDGRIRGEQAATGHALRDHQGPPPPLGGAGAALDEPLRDVVVVGGGLSGLAAVWALHRAGVDDLVVLERAEHLGGVSYGSHLDGVPCPWGAHYLDLPDPRSTVLMHLLSDLGIITDFTAQGRPVIPPRHRVRKPLAHVFHQGGYSRGFFPWLAASPRDEAQARALWQDMERWSRWTDAQGRPAFQLPVAYGSQATALRRLDAMSFADYLARRGWDSPRLRWYVDNRLTDEYGCRAEEISAYVAILLWAALGGSRGAAPTAGGRSEVISWPEGNMFLIRGLRRYLPPGGLRLGAWVTDVRHHRDEVHVSAWDPGRQSLRVYRGRRCVFAAPKLLAERVLPELADAGRGAASALCYSPWLVANLRLTRVPRHAAPALAWDNLIYDSWSLGFIDGDHLRRPEPVADPARHLTFYACFSGPLRAPARRDLLELDWDCWARLIVSELERFAPGVRPLVERLDVWRWGHAMVKPAPGLLFGGTRDELCRPLGRICFAGNDAGVLPLYEEAVYRGVAAAEQALAGLGRSFRSMLAAPLAHALPAGSGLL